MNLNEIIIPMLIAYGLLFCVNIVTNKLNTKKKNMQSLAYNYSLYVSAYIGICFNDFEEIPYHNTVLIVCGIIAFISILSLILFHIYITVTSDIEFVQENLTKIKLFLKKYDKYQLKKSALDAVRYLPIVILSSYAANLEKFTSFAIVLIISAIFILSMAIIESNNKKSDKNNTKKDAKNIEK